MFCYSRGKHSSRDSDILTNTTTEIQKKHTTLSIHLGTRISAQTIHHIIIITKVGMGTSTYNITNVGT